MNKFYDNQEENMSSKLSEHEFGMIPGAWEDMEKRLDKIAGPSVVSSNWSSWIIIGVILIVTTVGFVIYQSEMPFGKSENILPIVEKEDKNNNFQLKGNQENTNSNKAAQDPLNNVKSKAETEISNISSNNGSANPPNVTVITQNNSSDYNNINRMPIVSAEKTLTKESETIKTVEEPGIVAKTKAGDLNGQHSENMIVHPVYTRRVEVVHTFSESYVKWRNENLNKVIQPSGLDRKPLIDTPIISIDNPYAVPQKSVKFGVSAGVNTKIYNSNRFSVAPVLGAFLRKKFAGRYAMQAELQYKMILNQSRSKEKTPEYINLQVDVDPTNEFMFQERAAKVYNISEMHLLELPISFIYRLHKRHNVSLGLNAAYLYAVKTKNQEINSRSNEELGFSSVDLGAIAGYEFAINDNFALSVSYNVGFLNLARNTQNRQLAMADNAASYQLTNNTQVKDEECLMPVQVDENEQIFFQAPNNLYNTDLKILLRYIF